MKWPILAIALAVSLTAAAQRIPSTRSSPPQSVTVTNNGTTTPVPVTTPGTSAGGPASPSVSFPPAVGLPGQIVGPGATSERVQASQPRILPSSEPGVAPLVTAAQQTPVLPIGTISQAQVQLANQGFYRGPVTGTLTGPTRAALRQFQSSSGLPVTGELDLETAQRLGLPLSNASQILVVPTGPTDVGTFDGVGSSGNTIPTVQFRQDVGPIVEP